MNSAHTILETLGNNRFIAMTGAKSFVGDSKSLQFRLPANFAKNGINHVTITLDPSDTYSVRFGKLRGLNFKSISEYSGIYCDGLRPLFTSVTGLDTSLGTCGR